MYLQLYSKSIICELGWNFALDVDVLGHGQLLDAPQRPIQGETKQFRAESFA